MQSLDPLDIRDLLLDAQAEVATIIRETMKELALPQMLNALSMQWMVLPDEMKEKLRKEQPDAYRQIMELIGNETDTTAPPTY